MKKHPKNEVIHILDGSEKVRIINFELLHNYKKNQSLTNLMTTNKTTNTARLVTEKREHAHVCPVDFPKVENL